MKGEGAIRSRLRSLRVQAGLSQADLAAAAGVTRQTVGGIEAGLFGPSAAVALRLARALGYRVEEVFWLEDDLPPVEAEVVGAEAEPGARVALARVGGRRLAWPLVGAGAFRAEMVPADGVLEGEGAVRLLDEPEALERTVAVAGCTPVLSLWARAAERRHPGLRVAWRFANSTEALGSLARGEAHAAGLHLVEAASGEQNAPFVRRHLPGRGVALVNLGVWEEGLVTAPGNPRGLRGGADLARPDVRLVNREAGAGSRLLLDALLAEAGVPSAQVPGYRDEVRGHLEVAAAVAAGRADAGVTSACVAAAFGLGFVPVRPVRYDLAVPREFLEHPPVARLIGSLEDRWVRSQLAVLGGYETARTGEMTEVAA